MENFVPKAVAHIRQRCNRFCKEDSDDHSIHFAAYLFAVASKLPSEVGAAHLEDVALRPDALSSLSDALEHLESLPDDMDGPTLYQTLGKVLQVIEEEILDPEKQLSREAFAARRALPPSTRLDDCHELGFCGEVVHWLRRPAAFAKERGRRWRILEENHGTLPERPSSLPPTPAPHPSQFLSALSMFWNSDPQRPRLATPLALAYDRGSPLMETDGETVAGHGFRIALCPLALAPHLHPQFQVTPEGHHFRALGHDSLTDPEALDQHLDTLIRAASNQDVHLLVLPELMIGRRARGRIGELLEKYRQVRSGAGPVSGPWGILAGSFHFWNEDEEPVTHSPANESRLLGTRRATLLIHHKRGKFRISRQMFAASPAWFPDGPDKLPPGVNEVVEDIRHDGTVHVLDTRLGRFALAICADCIAPDWTNLEPLYSRLEPDLLFVVSMTPETNRFERFMDQMAERGIGTVFVNAACVCSEGSEILAAANLALPEPQGAPPTRVRWLSGKDEHCVEVRNYQSPHEAALDWHPLAEAVGETGVSWLEEDGNRLGLVLDLGVHWRWTPQHDLAE